MATSITPPSPTVSTTSPSTAMTTPEQPPVRDNDDDIWASDSDQNDNSRVEGSEQQHHNHRQDLLSDIPTIRRQHMTDGYREGLTVGKSKVMQQGFDAGYPIGIGIALRTGKILGVLEGCLAVSPPPPPPPPSSSSSASAQAKSRPLEEDAEEASSGGLRKMYEEACAELACSALMKGLNDEVVAEAKEIPSSIEMVIRKWERVVLGSSSDDDK